MRCMVLAWGYAQGEQYGWSKCGRSRQLYCNAKRENMFFIGRFDNNSVRAPLRDCSARIDIVDVLELILDLRTGNGFVALIDLVVE